MITKDINGNTLTADFISALTASDREYDARLLDDGTELDCSIDKITITKGSCGSPDGFTIGSIVGSTLSADVRGLSTAVKGKEIEAQIGLKVNGSFVYLTLGYFTVSEAKQNVYATTITAYGASITKTGGAFTAPATLTLANIASSISASASAMAGRTITVGFDVSINTTLTVTEPMNGLSAYQALEVLATVCGGYVIDTHDGNLKVCRFSDTPTLSRNNDTMLNLPVVEEEDFDVTGVVVTVKDGYEKEEEIPDPEDPEETITVEVYVPPVTLPATPTGYENLFIKNQYVTQALYTAHIATMANYEYRPATIGLTYGDPRLEGNDVVSVTDINSEVYIVPCHMLTHTYTGGFSTQISSVNATPQADEVASSAGSLTETLSDINASAVSARASAESAKTYAQQAKATTDEINRYADSVSKTVTQILAAGETAGAVAQQAIQDAGQARQSANQANLYATSALTNLGVVENVLDTLDWITKHGYYQLTADTSVVANKVYYSLTGTAITSPTGNPGLKLYYERSGSGTEADPYVYALSTDTAVDDQKTYYSVTAVSIAEPTGNPSENGYYELQMNSALSQYVSSHLALTDDGLTITNDNSAGSMLLSTTGVEIKNAGGVTVGKYGESAIIGAENAGHIEIKNGEIYFYSGAKTEMTPYDPEADPFCVAYVSNNELHIPRIIVIETLKMGNWRWDATIENHLSLNWIGG